jgi:hypothetical protein
MHYLKRLLIQLLNIYCDFNDIKTIAPPAFMLIFNINEEEDINTNPVSHLTNSSSAVLKSQFFFGNYSMPLHRGKKIK